VPVRPLAERLQRVSVQEGSNANESAEIGALLAPDSVTAAVVIAVAVSRISTISFFIKPRGYPDNWSRCHEP
jgi:hypothetical protein